MTSEPAPAPRGEAAWQAAKRRIADSNKAAYARGRQERSARDAEAAAARRAAERRDVASLPKRPRPSV